MDPTTVAATIPTTFPADTLPPIDLPQLTSTGAVIFATMMIVSILKKMLGDTPLFKKIPVFVYVTVIALVLTFVANQWMQTLPGDLKTVLWESLKAALAASGLFTLVKGESLKSLGVVSGNSEGPGTFGKIGVFLLLCLVIPAGTVGCADLFGTPAPIAADADPFVVNSERALMIAWTDLVAVFTFDDQNRILLKEKAPSLHRAVEILREDGTRSYESAVAAVRLYKETRLPSDKPDAQAKLEVVRDLARQARIALTAAQGVVKP